MIGILLSINFTLLGILYQAETIKNLLKDRDKNGKI